MPIAKGQFASTSTNGWGARVIQVVTNSTVNHSILCVDDDGTCVEGWTSGARITQASNYPNATWSNWDLTDEQAASIAQWGISHIGTPYGWLDCVAAGWNALHQRFGLPQINWVDQKLMDLKTLDCSQLVSEAYASIGINICPEELPCEVSPGDLDNVILAMEKTHG